jgi:acyl-CoA synthetase (AMP-forming)/AMP-acid ligase II
MSPVQYLESIAENFGDHIALDDGEVAVSYAELAVAVQAMSVALANMDPTPGSTVAICADYGHEYLVSVLAVQAAGKKLLPLSTQASTEELAAVVNGAQPSTIIVDPRGDALIPCEEDFKIHFSQFEGLVLTYRGEEMPAPPAPDTTAGPAEAEVSAQEAGRS